MFAWIGAQVREQLPAWPWTHPHPLYGIHNDLDSVLPWSVGMRALCTDAGIDHGIFIGTVIPYIWTLDLVLTFTFADALPSCVVVSVKPLESERYQRIDPLDRGPEKLELEKRYAKGIGIPYFLADRSLYPGDLLGQLEWLASTARLPTQDQKYALLQRFLDGCSGEFTSTPPSELIRKIKTDFAVSKAAADFIVQHCLWHQYIDCDLSRYLDMEAPPLPGGVALRSALRRTLEGVAP